MKKIILLFICWCCWGHSQAQTIADLEKSYVFVQAINYEKDSTLYHAQLIVSVFPDDTLSIMNHTIWFLADSLAGNSFLGSSFTATESSFPIGVYNLKVSPDSKYIAVFEVAEGHPFIELIDAQKLVLEKKYEVLHFLNPYPGSIEIVGWEDNLLVVESDMPLTDLNTQESLNYERMLEDFKKYTFDPITKKYAEKK